MDTTSTFNEYALKADYKIAPGTITVIGAQSTYDFIRSQDADFGPVPILQYAESEDYQQNSLEIRFVSEDNDNFEYLFGGYWQKSDLLINQVLDVATGPGTAVAGLFPFPTEFAVTTRLSGLDQETDTLAVFGQVSFGLAENWKLDISGRYSQEEKTATQYVDVYGGTGDGSLTGTALSNPTEVYIWSLSLLEANIHSTPIKRKENLFSPSVSLSWDASDTSNYYFSVSKGFKGGGFNAVSMTADVEDIEFENEEAISTEIGGKFELLDSTLIINTAIFNVDYDDMQTTLFTGGTTFVVENAAKANSRGLETEIRWLMTDEITLDVNIGLIDFEFKDYVNAGCTSAQLLESGLNGSACAAAGINDLTGRTNQDVPEITLGLSLLHETDIGEYSLSSRLDVNYVDEFYAASDLDPVAVQDAYTVVSASISLASPDSGWKADLIMKNITDEQYFYFSNDVPLFSGSQFVSFSTPMTATLQFSYLFE